MVSSFLLPLLRRWQGRGYSHIASINDCTGKPVSVDLTGWKKAPHNGFCALPRVVIPKGLCRGYIGAHRLKRKVVYGVFGSEIIKKYCDYETAFPFYVHPNEWLEITGEATVLSPQKTTAITDFAIYIKGVNGTHGNTPAGI